MSKVGVKNPPAGGKVQPAPAWADRPGAGGGAGAPQQAGPLPRKVAPKAVIFANGGQKGGRGAQVVDNSGTQSKPDLRYRDPNNINKHVKVHFEDVIGESENVRSIDCVWRSSFWCYSCWKGCCYKFLSLLVACPLSIIYGLVFFHTAFRHVWICTPLKNLMEISLVSCVGRFLKICLKCAVAPCFEACGQVFHHFNPNAKTTSPFSHGRVTKVQFNDKVKTKTIPKNNNVTGSHMSQRSPRSLAPASSPKPAKSGPLQVAPVGSRNGKVGPQGKTLAAEPDTYHKKEKGCVIM